MAIMNAHWSPTRVVQLELVDVDGVACGRKLVDVLHIFQDESVVSEESMCTSLRISPFFSSVFLGLDKALCKQVCSSKFGLI